MSSQSPEQAVISILQTTKDFVDASKEQFPDNKNSFEGSLDEVIGHLSMTNLARLGTRQSLQGGPEVVDAVSMMNEWARDETRLALGLKARRLYIARRNEALGELLEGTAVTIMRRPDAAPLSLATNPRDGFTPVEGPVTGTFIRANAEHGALGIGVRKADHAFIGPSEPLWIAHVLTPDYESQLDITIERAG